jgi:hypothetical protein
MIVTNPSAVIPQAPAFDLSEARWASAELAVLIDRLDPDSPIAQVLRQARRELASLTQGTTTTIGPFRGAA